MVVSSQKYVVSNILFTHLVAQVYFKEQVDKVETIVTPAHLVWMKFCLVELLMEIELIFYIIVWLYGHMVDIWYHIIEVCYEQRNGNLVLVWV